MRVITAPEQIQKIGNEVAIFLAGSIEQGTAELWQDRLIRDLAEADGQVAVLNPRRKEWDPTWDQSIDNPLFKEQVVWEMDALDSAHIIVFYFDPNTKAPITLMELGLHVDKSECIVCCPPGYWRKGNVDILCERYGVPVYETYDAFLVEILNNLQ